MDVESISAPLADDDLARWAREHLVYEGRMLAFAAVRLAERQGLPRDPESNALLESFVVHVRCLRDFLWGRRRDRQPHDAFAVDFCAPGEWERVRGDVPGLLGGRLLHRAGREVVHLTYHRFSVDAASKDWDCGEIFDMIASSLERLAITAMPTRMDGVTRTALGELWEHQPGAGTASVATGAAYGLAFHGGTIAFPRFEHGS